jgi:hypothetical protein
MLANGQVKAAQNDDELSAVYLQHEKVRIIQSRVGPPFPSIAFQRYVSCVCKPEKV